MNVKLICSVMIVGTGIRKGEVDDSDHYFEEEFKINTLGELEKLVKDFKEDCIDDAEARDTRGRTSTRVYRSGEFEYMAVVDVEIEGV